MHEHRIAHLDISLRNLVTNFNGGYAYIDFELSRNFEGILSPRIFGHHATEVPPECDNGTWCDPFKVDVWALGVLALRTCKVGSSCCTTVSFFDPFYLFQMMEIDIPELIPLTAPMLNACPEARPQLLDVLKAFDAMTLKVRDRMPHDCTNDST